MENLLIPLVIIIITAISGWLQKKGQAEEPGSLGEEWKTIKPRTSEPPRQTTPPQIDPGKPSPRPTAAIDWEKELRRLLQGDAPAAPPPLPLPPQPPVVARETSPRTVPPPISAPRKSAPSPRSIVPVEPEEEEGPQFTPAAMAESSKAYKRAQQLHENVAGRLRKIDEQTESHKPDVPGHFRKHSPEITSAMSLLRRPRMARQAIILSIILGPPKALEG
jgi:hypothetical protein